MRFRNKRNGDVFLIGDDVIIDVATEHQGLGSSDVPEVLGDATPPPKSYEAGPHRSRVVRPIAGLALGSAAIALVSTVALPGSGGGQPIEEPEQPAASAEVSLAAPGVAKPAAPIPAQAPKAAPAPSNDSARESRPRADKRDREPQERPDDVSSSPAPSSPAPSPPVAANPSPSSDGGSGGGENFGIEQ